MQVMTTATPPGQAQASPLPSPLRGRGGGRRGWAGLSEAQPAWEPSGRGPRPEQQATPTV